MGLFLLLGKSTACWYSLAAMPFRIAQLDHVQIVAPPGSEAAARDFYGSLLGMPEFQKTQP